MPRRFRCPACRTRRTSFVLLVKHCSDHSHTVCTCGGYHYAHRPGSPCCERNPMGPVHSALRAGADNDEAWRLTMDIVWDTPGKPMEKWR
ncbi:hypothetical protein Daci_3420 [Delftia acidovorans SPH-1]|uniref:Uncharacterized protein n=1 Tax=Delftia acidovorans (strain DSM 14801 / SPH-1) TaxID=398578 RepID=A9C2B4_DELAS|nr:hypothetical protein [Delftia acidovorans]ABX36058.1 hypothetical protein Daci_3420 [Delftia acidovorans SPH-1]QPS74660.1 hypothetical protein I6G48_29325 [Delftia acidovorans]